MSALASILSLALAEDVTNNALLFFIIADVFILLCIVSYWILPKMAYSRSVTAKTVSPVQTDGFPLVVNLHVSVILNVDLDSHLN